MDAMNTKKLTPPETFGEMKTVGQGIAALSKLAGEVLEYTYDLHALPPKLVIDIYKIACIARSVEISVTDKKVIEAE